MKRLILLALIGFVYPNFSYANTPKTCGSNIKDGIVICYDLKSYNKNPKISFEFGNGFEEEEEDYSNDEWKINYNLKANLSYKVVVKQNNKITFIQNYNSMDYLDTEYDVYYTILRTNNTAQSDLISYKIHPKNFYPQYSAQLSQIIKTYKNLDENSFEIKKSEYLINTLTPLLEPEKLQLKKVEDKRNSILPDDYNQYLIYEENKIKVELKKAEDNLDKFKKDYESDINDPNTSEAQREHLKYNHDYNLNEVEGWKDKYQDELIYNNKYCKIYYPYNGGNGDDTTYYAYHHIEDCYKKFIDDENKLEMLHNIDNIYIKQHKKVQFIIDTIEENKSNIENIKKKIESDKMKKDLEKELS